jgi:hypothetical protein
MKTWIWAILAIVIIGGGAYWWMQQNHSAQAPTNQEQTYTPPATTQTTNNTTQTQPTQTTQTQTTSTSNTKIYANTQYGFAVNYPVDTTADLSNPGRFSNGSVSFSVGSGQTGSGRLDMGFPLPVSYCDVPKNDASHKAPTDLITKTIGGINFSVYTNTSLAPTESYSERIYQGLRDNDCYFFSETIMGGSVMTSAQIRAKLDAIVNSFHFTN